jgi:light-regulated signal transduction histidine kinase (bacteriophytochrome)
MGRLVDDLLTFSRMARAHMRQHRVDLAQLVAEVRAELRRDSRGRYIQWKIHPLPEVRGDAPMLRVVLMNLMGNAVKYTRVRSPALIEVGANGNESEHTIFVRDNGVGFDMKYAGKLFGVFQRLHFEDEYEGTGIGLASVHRIVLRHGGRAWAEGKENEGATFYFTLPKVPEAAEK